MHLVILLPLKSTEELIEKVLNGQVLPEHPLLESEEAIVFMNEGKALAVYRKHPTKAWSYEA